MRDWIILSLVALGAAALMGTLGCGGAPERDTAGEEEPVVLESGSTDPNPDYFVTDTGDIIYSDTRTRLAEGGSPFAHNPDFPAMFPGAQRIFPANENPSQRESYLIRAPLEAVEQFYRDYLAGGDGDGDDSTEEDSEEGAYVNSISSRDPSGRRQTALFVNDGDGPRGGMKVMLKEFPAQHAVQIVLTTLYATPPGLDPVGIYVTPEEVAEWAEEWEAEREEIERQRAEAEARAIDPHRDGGDDENSGEEAD